MKKTRLHGPDYNEDSKPEISRQEIIRGDVWKGIRNSDKF